MLSRLRDSVRSARNGMRRGSRPSKMHGLQRVQPVAVLPDRGLELALLGLLYNSDFRLRGPSLRSFSSSDMHDVPKPFSILGELPNCTVVVPYPGCGAVSVSRR